MSFSRAFSPQRASAANFAPVVDGPDARDRQCEGQQHECDAQVDVRRLRIGVPGYQHGQQRARHGSRQNHHPTHRRRTRLALVALRPLLANLLPQLFRAQKSDHRDSGEKGDQKGQPRGGNEDIQ